MGILNVTDDSFHAPSRITDREELMAAATQMMDQGADILDIGACSTRPGAESVPEKVETQRLVAAIDAVRQAVPNAIISADTFRSRVAEAAVAAGAHLINDISGGSLDADMFDAVAKLRVPYVLSHTRGTPKTMNSEAHYRDVVDEVILELSRKLRELRALGVADVIVDPGFGFAKTVSHNFEMLRRLEEFGVLDAPLMVGLSRKSMVWRTLNTTPEQALNGTTALHMQALQGGANILRVHDVKEARETIRLHEALRSAGEPTSTNSTNSSTDKKTSP